MSDTFTYTAKGSDMVLRGLAGIISEFGGGWTATARRMSGANVRRRRQAWRRAQPIVGGINCSTYTFWRAVPRTPGGAPALTAEVLQQLADACRRTPMSRHARRRRQFGKPKGRAGGDRA